MATTSSARKTRGRQKVAMVRMQKESNRLVTFSKRRTGLFKKASELCTLCGAEAVVVVFSPGNKAYSFGHPSVELITDRFLYRDNSTTQLYENRHIQEMPKLEALLESNKEVSDLKDKMDLERKRTEEFLNIRKTKSPEVLKFLAPVDELTLQELKQIQASLIGLRSTVYQYQQNMVEAHSISNSNSNSNSVSLLTQNPVGPIQPYFPSNILGGQNYDQMMIMPPPSIIGGPNDNPPIMMIPTPMRAFDDPSSLAMRSNMMNSRFTNLNGSQPYQPLLNPIQDRLDINQSMLPFQWNNNDPIPGQYDIRQTIPPFDRNINPIHDQFDIHQSMPTDIERFPISSGHQSLTNLLNSTNQPSPFDPQEGFGFGQRMD
ncbi:hypothetical protein vseg_012778 [Gypsophila vaccaria]